MHKNDGRNNKKLIFLYLELKVGSKKMRQFHFTDFQCLIKKWANEEGIEVGGWGHLDKFKDKYATPYSTVLQPTW